MKLSKNKTKTKIKSDELPDFITFWRPRDQNAVYGQWYLSDFVLNDNALDMLPQEMKELNIFISRPDIINNLMNITCNCAEQFMMLGKALLFKDNIVAKLIVKERNPMKHKSLGRKVKKFNDDLWNEFADDIVILGNYLKFTQDEQANDLILESADAVLIEGSPMDRIWGVGLKFDDPKILDETQWKGQNKLGECLMKVRTIIFNNS
jgi:ribA/ribD-fused uncharacterized protein